MPNGHRGRMPGVGLFIKGHFRPGQLNHPRVYLVKVSLQLFGPFRRGQECIVGLLLPKVNLFYTRISWSGPGVPIWQSVYA